LFKSNSYTLDAKQGVSYAEIHMLQGKIHKITVRDKGPGLDSRKKKEFEEFVNAHANEIVEKWVDYFVKKNHIIPQIITQRVRNARTIG